MIRHDKYRNHNNDYALSLSAKEKTLTDGIVGFFNKTHNGDLIQFKHNGKWTSTWTAAAHSAKGACMISHQYLRIRAEALRHAEYVILNRPDGCKEHAVVITELPAGDQAVVLISTGTTLRNVRWLESPTLAALIKSINTDGDVKGLASGEPTLVINPSNGAHQTD